MARDPFEPRPGGPIKGRGTALNPPNRFDRLSYDDDPESFDPAAPRPKTEVYVDASRSILARNDSPDVGFDVSINPYRGCQHGCVYCFARPSHETLGLSSGLDFETKIFAKPAAAKLLRAELAKPGWEPQTIAMSGVTDPYQPAERTMGITRGCLEVLAEFRNPVAVITKNHLVTRDRDLLVELARHDAAAVFLSVTTLDGALQRTMEPRASAPERRLAAIRELAAAGVPAGVMVGPVIPGLTDHEIPAILDAAARAGARHAGYVVLRLPHAVKDIFERWLADHFPERKEKVLSRIRSLRGGKLYDSTFGVRGVGEGVFADEIRSLFVLATRRAGIAHGRVTLSTAAFRRPASPQLALF